MNKKYFVPHYGLNIVEIKGSATERRDYFDTFGLAKRALVAYWNDQIKHAKINRLEAEALTEARPAFRLRRAVCRPK